MAINVNQGVQTTPAVKTDKIDQNIQKQQVAQQQATLNAPAQKQDSVSLTTQAQQFTKAQEKASNSSGIDQKKIDDIKQAIAEGKYKINVEQLAKRIVQFEGELFNKR
ncbi:MAG: flagellar biosynthesis anti-sigma factor FlgM [Gammaproteobacteria bacterium]|jgi:negative regulator of flagellin synthesis FlgM|nr:flagellar biosynthesis anti-sigma factor FlgM [Gammaproteobacteria bacterium]MBU2178842.1 flagellar biosynthesis anti-sigma factor FlgM [Gammaproteobacteria bacterium]MBU2224567.1 flagellar biosynthesis anti-sigma factor FlgM [Gammaproteobacteria bacterium]MBU2280278.1 flagellar biosynthesis anti-sigma factor FlgM [Gammaproteobacteria bacterium]MBU2427541.1 flagellar biosynthesis anti-sigma factor FlgM [Gammaproteobacteria bacterium]